MDVRVDLDSVALGIARQAPYVVVGSGPVGARAVQELVRSAPGVRIVWYGDEPWQPYNRVKLSSLLAGDVGWDELTTAPVLSPAVECRFGMRVSAIDREQRIVTDAGGRAQAYRALILATGSRAHVPNIPGVELPGVFTLRDLSDAQRLQARTVRARVCVVIGGGLLGLEAARAMRRYHTEVWVVEHSDRLMSRQLDREAAQMVCRQIEDMGIRVRAGEGVRGIVGNGAVAGVQMRDGSVMRCDTVILSTGIVPNIDLARQCGLAVGRGITVDDRMLSADPCICAVGECAEHRGTVHGLVAPGLEQAAVAANVLSGGSAQYEGSISATNLKVLGCKVFSIGVPERSGPADIAREIAYRAPDGKTYRKLVVRQGRLTGAIGIGDWPERSRIQEAVRTERFVYPWQLWSLARVGRLWSEEDAADVALWPADATICNCTGVTKGTLEIAQIHGCNTVESLCATTGAGTVCGSCRPLLADLAGGQARLPALPGWRSLWLVTLAAALLAVLYALIAIPFPDTANLRWRWDAIWRDSLWKQVSGYSAIALMASLAVISLRKRWSRIKLWAFDSWRLVHVVLGVAVALTMFAHTGGRMGDQLDFMLSLAAVLALLSGVAIASVLARQQDLTPRMVKSAQKSAVWTHVLSLWALPALLGYHILKAYYF
jgi:nitrite reductase (NADH) large subunit